MGSIHREEKPGQLIREGNDEARSPSLILSPLWSDLDAVMKKSLRLVDKATRTFTDQSHITILHSNLSQSTIESLKHTSTVWPSITQVSAFSNVNETISSTAGTSPISDLAQLLSIFPNASSRKGVPVSKESKLYGKLVSIDLFDWTKNCSAEEHKQGEQMTVQAYQAYGVRGPWPLFWHGEKVLLGQSEEEGTWHVGFYPGCVPIMKEAVPKDITILIDLNDDDVYIPIEEPEDDYDDDEESAEEEEDDVMRSYKDEVSDARRSPSIKEPKIPVVRRKGLFELTGPKSVLEVLDAIGKVARGEDADLTYPPGSGNYVRDCSLCPRSAFCGLKAVKADAEGFEGAEVYHCLWAKPCCHMGITNALRFMNGADLCPQAAKFV